MDMRTYAKLYIGAVLAGGMVCFAHAMTGWTCQHPLRYLCLLAVALPASALKVFLPGVTGTMSVSYVFVLLGMLDFSHPETMLLACLAMIVQSLWRTRYHPKLLHVLFNLASTSIAVSFGFGTYRLIGGQRQVLLSVAIASTVYFLTNSLSVAAVVAVTEAKSLRKIWHECYLWTFPYYLVGGAVAYLISWCNRHVGWETTALALPVVYVIFRSYRLYLVTTHWASPRTWRMASSTLRWGTISPPILLKRERRSVMRRKPSSSSSATSPVMYQPSRKTSAVRSGWLR